MLELCAKSWAPLRRNARRLFGCLFIVRRQNMPHHHCDFSFSYHPNQRARFRDGSLVQEWSNRYPNLFDDDDRRVLRTDHQRKFHFLEWLSAILIFESTGYLSFVEKYTTKSHPTKRRKLEAFLPACLFRWLAENESGQPDLFVYQPRTGDWFFCEVKDEVDRIRANQLSWSKSLNHFLVNEGIPSQRRTRVLCLQQVDA